MPGSIRSFLATVDAFSLPADVRVSRTVFKISRPSPPFVRRFLIELTALRALKANRTSNCCTACCRSTRLEMISTDGSAYHQSDDVRQRTFFHVSLPTFGLGSVINLHRIILCHVAACYLSSRRAFPRELVSVWMESCRRSLRRTDRLEMTLPAYSYISMTLLCYNDISVLALHLSSCYMHIDIDFMGGLAHAKKTRRCRVVFCCAQRDSSQAGD